jgi:hypothetical protein
MDKGLFTLDFSPLTQQLDVLKGNITDLTAKETANSQFIVKHTKAIESAKKTSEKVAAVEKEL